MVSPRSGIGYMELLNFCVCACMCVCICMCVCDHVHSHSRSLKVQGRDYLRSTALSVHWDASLFMKRYFKA